MANPLIYYIGYISTQLLEKMNWQSGLNIFVIVIQS